MSCRHTSASKRTAKPAQVTRTKQSFDDQLRRISDEKEDNSLIIPISLLVIASYLNRLHFKEIINERLRWDPAQWKYSPAVLAQIMVLSVFVPSRKKVALSRIHEAFAGIDLTYLVGEEIDPETLNDDLFGQLLDRMYEYGFSTLYRSISLTVRTTFDLPQNYFLHSDTTSHVLTGEYECSQSQEISTVIKPTYGVSKEKRADLKQIMSGSVTDGDGLVLFCHILDGNTADCEYNNLIISTLQSVYRDEFGEYTYIADCKILTEKKSQTDLQGCQERESSEDHLLPTGQFRRKIDSFCLLTSISPEEMNSREVLLNYKRQNVVESMFSLLKEPLLASTIFLEKPERIKVLMTILYFSVFMHGILLLITRNRIEKLPKVPKIGPENRPLLCPKSGTVLNILENFEIVTVDGVLKKIRSKQKNRSTQLDLIMYLVYLPPPVI